MHHVRALSVHRLPVEAVSVDEKVQWRQTDNRLFWDENICIVLDAHLPIFSTGIDEIKPLSIIFTHIILLIFIPPPPNTRLLQGEGTLVTTPYGGEADSEKNETV
jgi:hypothetical protein